MYEKVSILMASYNYARYIGEAIDSVISQTYKNWELIIIDDASSDNSLEIINTYVRKDERIKLVINDKNIGLAKTIQKGIQFAEGHLIAFLESDDIWLENSLEEKVKAMHNGADIAFTDVELFNNLLLEKKYNEIFKYRNENIIKLNKSQFIYDISKYIYNSNIIPTFSSVITKKELLEKCKYNPIIPSNLDHYLWGQLCFYKFYYINEKLTKWRLHNDSFINTVKKNGLKQIRFDISIYKETIKNKNFLIKMLLLINFTRKKLIYYSQQKL